MDLKENKEKEEVNDEGCPKPLKPEDPKDKNICKINKILSDNITEEKVFDLLFVIDATGSMSSYIRAAKDETENISKELRSLYPEYNFQYGYIFYRDPIDSHEDKHEVINLTNKVNTLPEQIKKIRAYGGGDLPEDWVGAFKLANEKITWRNGIKVIIHLADAGAHGKEFTLSDSYPEESDKLKVELLKCCQKKIKIFGYVITEDARHSFNQSQKYYRSNGGSYEICEFKISKEYSDDEKEDYVYKRPIKKKRFKHEEDFKVIFRKRKLEYEGDKDSKKYEKYKEKKSKKKRKEDSENDEEIDIEDEKKYKKKHKKLKYFCEEENDEDEDMNREEIISPEQKTVNDAFRTEVLKSIKFTFDKKYK